MTRVCRIGRLGPETVLACLLAVTILAAGCATARKGRLAAAVPLSPVPAPKPDTAQIGKEQREEQKAAADAPIDYYTLFWSADTLIGFQPGTADSTKRYLGRLKFGYTVDTLNVLLCGDNRPAYRNVKYRSNLAAISGIKSLNPIRILRGLVTIPYVIVRGLLLPPFDFWHDAIDMPNHTPKWGREHSIVEGMIARVDTIESKGETVAAVINTGDVVTDGQYPAHWKRFLRITRPLSKRIPYFPVAGNHERTDTELGIANWRTATGLPVGGDRLYYCFDSADGWVRFIALDSNPMTDPANYWARDTEVKYSDEQITWTIQRLKEHVGPALVFLHHPPFCIGYHRPEWENDPVLRERRARLVKALQESGLSLLVAGHEHAYERALLTSGDAVLIVIVTGGAGSPLHRVPVAQAPALFSQYQVEGSQFKPENVYAADAFHYIHLRLWFGGGQFFTYEVDNAGHQRLIDQATIDLKRWGVPEIDQHKVVLPPKPQGPSQPPPKEETAKKASVTTTSDSLSATQRLKSGSPPAKKAPVRKPAPRPKARPR